MKTGLMTKLSMAVVLLAATSSTFAGTPYDFYGWFAGYFAPANWTQTPGGNPTYQGSASMPVFTENMAFILGAVGPSPTPVTPYSTYELAIATPGTDPQMVQFSWNFGYGVSYSPGDFAQFIYTDQFGTHTEPLIGGGNFNPTGELFTGLTSLKFVLTSDNEVHPDWMSISPIPEPSTMALFGIGLGALLWRARRKA